MPCTLPRDKTSPWAPGALLTVQDTFQHTDTLPNSWHLQIHMSECFLITVFPHYRSVGHLKDVREINKNKDIWRHRLKKKKEKEEVTFPETMCVCVFSRIENIKFHRGF